MKVCFNQIPQEGLHLQGERPLSEPLLCEADGVLRQTAPLRFQMNLGRDGSGIWITGRLEVEVEAECVRCLNPFALTLRVEDFAAQFEIRRLSSSAHLSNGDFVDLTEQWREDILLILPSYPKCDRDGGLTCAGLHMHIRAGERFLDQRPEHDQDSRRTGSSLPTSPDTVWGVLDHLPKSLPEEVPSSAGNKPT